MSLQSEQLAGNGLRKVTVGLGAGLAALGASATMTYGYMQARDYQEYRAQWIELQSLLAATEYEKCQIEAQNVVPSSRYFSGAQSVLQQCRFGLAQQQAARQDYSGAIASALLIPASDEKLHQQAQPLIQDWSNAVVKQGQTLFQAGQLEAAIAQLRALPAELPVAQGREATIQRWQADWTQSETALKTAQELLGRGQWLAAKTALGKVSGVEFWQRKAKPLMVKADAGIARVEQYQAEQQPYVSPAALAAAPSAVYTPPAWDDAPVSSGSWPSEPAAPSDYWEEPGAAPAPVQASSYVPPSVTTSPAAAAPSAPGFDQSVEGLYQSYKDQGQGTWDAWGQACADSGGRLVDQGPESACLP